MILIEGYELLITQKIIDCNHFCNQTTVSSLLVGHPSGTCQKAKGHADFIGTLSWQ